MILTRSPFYKNVNHWNTFVTSIDFKVEVGTGPLSNPDILNFYDLTIPKASNATINTFVDLSPLVRDFYEFSPIDFSGIISSSVVESSEKSVLITRVTAVQKDTLGGIFPVDSQKHISLDGFGYYFEGQNFETTKKILLTHSDYLADTRGFFAVPLRVAAGDADPTVNGTPVLLNFVDNNKNYVKYLLIPINLFTGNIVVSFAGETVNIQPIDECKYNLNEIQFINRCGVFETLHFYKVRKDNLKTKSDSFKNANTDGIFYDPLVHQTKKLNAAGNKTVRIETGFLNENYNETIQELLLSEHVWLNRTPVNINTASLEMKTKIVDKLISYSIEMDYAFDLINNV